MARGQPDYGVRVRQRVGVVPVRDCRSASYGVAPRRAVLHECFYYGERDHRIILIFGLWRDLYAQCEHIVVTVFRVYIWLVDARIEFCRVYPVHAGGGSAHECANQREHGTWGIYRRVLPCNEWRQHLTDIERYGRQPACIRLQLRGACLHDGGKYEPVGRHGGVLGRNYGTIWGVFNLGDRRNWIFAFTGKHRARI